MRVHIFKKLNLFVFVQFLRIYLRKTPPSPDRRAPFATPHPGSIPDLLLLQCYSLKSILAAVLPFTACGQFSIPPEWCQSKLGSRETDGLVNSAVILPMLNKEVSIHTNAFWSLTPLSV